MQEYFTALFISKLESDKKSKAYKSLAAALEESSTDYSFTFWSLCHELDETPFALSFLIPKLKEILKLLDKKEGITLIKAYDRFAHLSILLDNTDKGIYHVYYLTSTDNAIIEFCNVLNFGNIWDFPANADINATLYAMENEMNEYIDLSNTLVLDLFYVNGFGDILSELRTNIFTKIRDWQSLITKE